MRTRLPILLGLVLMLSAAGYAAALTDNPAVPASDRIVTSTTSAAPVLAADPFLALSDITSSAPTDRAVCPCSPGYNCCGDNPEKRGCGINWSCRCKAGGVCTL